jgi:RNA polymerase sigma-70 factor (ECF subfamily)
MLDRSGTTPTGPTTAPGAPAGDHPPAGETEATRLFTAQRDFLLGVAYRILGRVTDAEDVVQEAWLRWSRTDPGPVDDARAFLVRVTTRLALDRLRRIKARHEAYVGPWLPEPLLTGPDVAQDVELAESVSFALLIVLETLSPLERAVFVLREVFAFSFAEIAQILDRSEVAVRQVASRARGHVRERRPRFDSDPATRRRVTERFMAACQSGDVATLMGVLAPGVRLEVDSGGKVRAPQIPLRGAPAVVRFLAFASTQPYPDLKIVTTDLNGGPGLIITSEGTAIGAVVLDVADGLVEVIRMVANPEKLAGLAPGGARPGADGPPPADGGTS